MTTLKGKVAVVTGAGRGLGQVVATGLAAKGAAVALVARSADQLEQAAKAIGEQGGKAIICRADISQPSEVERLHEQVMRELGAPSILVNAAGVFGPIQPIVQTDVTRWLETLNANLVGPYLTCRAFAAGMVANGWGRIINFSSAASLHPPGPLNSAYGTSKVALNQFTRHLAAELAGTGVTANVIHPGEAKTAMWQAIRDEAEQLGPSAAAYQQWAAGVGESGGDSPVKALELVLEIIGGEYAAANGEFLWIKGGQQMPIASW